MTRRNGKPTASGSNAGNTGKRPHEGEAPLSMHRILHGCDDPREPHLRKFLCILGRNDSSEWREVADLMAAYVTRTLHDEHFREKTHQNSRQTSKETLREISKIARKLNELTGRNDVIDLLRSFAPHSERGPDDITGYEYLVALAARADRAAGHITAGPGDRTLLADLGFPSAKRLCATMVREAWKLAHGGTPGEGNTDAHAACEALWMAAGGADAGPDDAGGRWVRPLREAVQTNAGALDAHMSAAACLSALQQERP